MNTTIIVNKTSLQKTIMTAFLFCVLSVFSFAQDDALLAFNDLSPKGIVTEEWSFFYDEENEIYYIDFETISLNLTQIKLVAQDGKEIIADSVADLPVNTIYELDCSQLNAGQYTVELHSYTDILKKEVIIE